jgi:tetratricopeptide (TPR) repeat protein
MSDAMNFDLGTHTREITTLSEDAQRWFDQGLNWCFGFNQEEGVACFKKALEFDPECAMAYWGIAYGSGPFYNRPWRHLGNAEADECTKQCFDNITMAVALAENVTPCEQDLINALAARYPIGQRVTHEEFDDWDTAYANALRDVYAKYPEDLDVAALFAEALITRTPWQLWNVKTNQPAAGADTKEAIEVCERAIALADKKNLPQHPGVLHIHIHALEMSPEPQRAMRSADVLGTLSPDAGHLNHMPGHIYVLCGLYDKAKIASEKAIRGDNMFVEYAGPFNFYTTARCHDLHLMMYTCMLLGQYEPALNAANDMCATLTREVLAVGGRPQLAATMEGYYSMKMHVFVRFGKWREILDEPMPEFPELYCVSTAMHHYAKGVANAALGNIADAEVQLKYFDESLARIPADRKFFNNFALNVVAVGRAMLTGELAYRKGDFEQAFEHLRESVTLDDNLEYSEPWVWMHPPRHALGALLMEQGLFDEAEPLYRADLGLSGELQRCAQHPDNVWALHGLLECLRNRNEVTLLPTIEEKYRLAASQTDVPVTSSCCCRKNVSHQGST